MSAIALHIGKKMMKGVVDLQAHPMGSRATALFFDATKLKLSPEIADANVHICLSICDLQ